METKTQADTCPHTRSHLCEACRESRFRGNRCVALTDTETHLRHFSQLGLRGILHQLSSLKLFWTTNFVPLAKVQKLCGFFVSFELTPLFLSLIKTPSFILTLMFPLMVSPTSHRPTAMLVLPALLKSVLSISKDVASPVTREHLHNRPYGCKACSSGCTVC